MLASNQQYNTNLRVGDSVVFTAPSGRMYEAIILETDWIGHEVNLLVEFTFTWNNRAVKSTGWQPFSSIRQPAADVCPACGELIRAYQKAIAASKPGEAE